MFKRFILYLFFSLVGLQLAYAVSDPSIEKYFAKKEVTVKIYKDTFQNRAIRYIETYQNEDVTTLVFLLHGARSKAMRFKKIMADESILKNARVVALDRPGYDHSSPGEPLTSIEDQAKFVEYVLDKFNFETCILVGHSYGSAIVAQYAATHPEQNLKLLLLSPAIDPSLEKVFSVSKLLKYKFAKKILPEQSWVAAMENLSHKTELKKILPIWSSLEIPVYHIHGIQDKVISYKNIYFSNRQIKPEYLKIKLLGDIGHLLLMFKSDEIVASINELMSVETYRHQGPGTQEFKA